MTERLWNRPVIIELEGVARRYIRNTREAAWWLLDEWPAEKGDAYRRALLGCTRALAGLLPDPAARHLFTQAAQDAELRVSLSSDIREYDPFMAELSEATHRAMFTAPADEGERLAS